MTQELQPAEAATEIVQPKQTAKRSRRQGPRTTSLKHLLAKKFDFLKDLPVEIERSLGQLVSAFIMIVWGQSGNGKSNFIYQLLKVLMNYGNVLYLALEEGFETTTQMVALRHLNEEDHSGKILFADHTMTYEEAMLYLKRKKSPKFIIIDSVQYWDINYAKYKLLKESFPNKTFIFISHAKGSNPDGTTAQKIRYDAGIKVHVKAYVAHPTSRYGGNKPYIIWEEGAIKEYGKKKVNEFKK
jgi:hypothetical protein